MDSCVTHPLIDEAESGVPATALTRKASGAYFTPDAVVATLVRWAVRRRDDRLLDPSCGDGTFLAAHARSIGVEVDAESARLARQRAPLGEVHVADFFAWAERTGELFDCAAGNPPFIRYQRSTGETRERALRVCRGLGATFSGLTSSWAPFLVATAALLRPGGRMAFVIPAEAGHAPYAVPLLEYLVGHFSTVHVVAIREKLYPDLSEDCWLLLTDGFGGRTTEIRFSAFDRFVPSGEPPQSFASVDLDEWRQAWRHRLRPYLMPPSARETYRSVVASTEARRLGEIASVGIGYVTGANDFFHLRPSQARRLRIPGRFLSPSVRNGRVLSGSTLSAADIARWRADDKPFLLLRLPKEGDLPAAVEAYLDTEAGRVARTAYKCRTRTPWHSVPDVQVPDYLLSYMSGERPSLVRNDVGCTATNSVHCLRLRHPASGQAFDAWGSPFVDLSCELEGHPLGGGMLKLEPREAARLVLPAPGQIQARDEVVCREAVAVLRRWRHRPA